MQNQGAAYSTGADEFEASALVHHSPVRILMKNNKA